jgi:hypothetical protein
VSKTSIKWQLSRYATRTTILTIKKNGNDRLIQIGTNRQRIHLSIGGLRRLLLRLLPSGIVNAWLLDSALWLGHSWLLHSLQSQSLLALLTLLLRHNLLQLLQLRLLLLLLLLLETQVVQIDGSCSHSTDRISTMMALRVPVSTHDCAGCFSSLWMLVWKIRLQVQQCIIVSCKQYLYL